MNSNQLYVPCSLLFSKYYKLTISVTYMYMVATGYIQVDGPLYCLFYELFLVIFCTLLWVGKTAAAGTGAKSQIVHVSKQLHLD